MSINKGDEKSVWPTRTVPGMELNAVYCLQTLEETPCGDEDWSTTEGLWFTREEAEAYARECLPNMGYRPDEWRVYGKSARGQLKDMLAAVSERAEYHR